MDVLRDRVDEIFPGSPQTAGILRAMLLGDRSFVERSESVDFQKTGVFHVLVVAGLHVGALALFLFWLARKLRMPQIARTCFVLAAAVGLRGCGGAARSGVARGIDGGDRNYAGGIFTGGWSC